jgi:hypothetical protein
MYQKYLSNSQSVIFGWSQLYYAMILTGAERTTYLLKTFDNSESKKVFCYQQISTDDLDTLEQQTSDKHMLALIYAMRAIKTPARSMPLIQTVYVLDPASKYLPFLISREINKLENWIWGSEIYNFNTKASDEYFGQNSTTSAKPYSYFAQKNLMKDRGYLIAFRSCLEQMNIPNKDYLNLALAHLYNMSGEYSLALQKINQTKNFNDTLYATQKLIEHTIALSNVYDIRKNSIENILYKNISAIITLNPNYINGKEYEDRAETNNVLSKLLLLLSRQYQKKGNIAIAGLMSNKSDFPTNLYSNSVDSTYNDNYSFIGYFDNYANAETIDSLLALRHKRNKTDFEKYITIQQWTSDDFLRDLKGTILLRQQKYTEALKVFEQIPPNFWQKSSFPYQDYLRETRITKLGTLTPWIKDTRLPYSIVSKKLIVQDIVDILQQLKNEKDNEKRSQLYYLLGNAEYNMSHDGLHWMMTSYSWSLYTSGNEPGTDSVADNKFLRNYYGCAQAIVNYKNALSLTHQPERKAAILLMLSLCDKTIHAYQARNNYDYNTKKYISPYLQTLKKQYGTTQTYKLAITYCPDIKDDISSE